MICVLCFFCTLGFAIFIIQAKFDYGLEYQDSKFRRGFDSDDRMCPDLKWCI